MSVEARTDGTPVVDFAAHLHPTPLGEPGIFEHIEAQTGGPVHSDPELAAALFDRAGVDRAVLSQSNYMGYDDPEAVRAANDDLRETVVRFDRFYGLAALPVGAGGEPAATEFERCLSNGYHGGALETESGGIGLTDRAAEPVLEVADRTGAPLLVPPVIDDSLGAGVLDDRWHLNAIWGREVALCRSLVEVIHEGVLDRYPGLNLVYHHAGGGIATMMGRLRLYLEGDRMPDGADRLDYGAFKRRLEDRIYVDLSGHFGDPAVYRKTFQEFPSSQVLFGTDFPYETRTPAEFRRLVRSVRESTSHRDAARILGGNALDLLDD